MMVRAKGLNAFGSENCHVPLVNRTGAATVLGGVYAVDTTGSATESTDPESNWSNVVAAATANLSRILVVALGVYADDATGLFALVDPDVRVLVDGTTDVAEGDELIAVNAATNLAKQGSGSLVRACGIALEVRTDNSAGLMRVFFDGRGSFKAVPAS